MYKRSESETRIIGELVGRWFSGPVPKKDDDAPTIDAIVAYVDTRFSDMKYILGLAIDFVVLAQQVAGADRSFQPLAARDSVDPLFKRYPRVEQRGSRGANTLTLTVGETNFGIRKIEELVVDAFHKMERSEFPSAYVYNTGQWSKYKDLLALTFRLSSGDRRRAVERLFDFGLERLERNTFYFQPRLRTRVFNEVVTRYERSADGENGGLTLQAMVYGWCSMMFSHLHIDADKVRTGSKRQRRFGDIDGYLGLELELSVEVKDMTINSENYERQIRKFAELVGSHNIHGLVIAGDFTKDVFETAEADGLVVMTVSDLQRNCQMWDWAKQDRALHAMLHYLAHIEQNPAAVKRLLAFVRSVDEGHQALTHLT
jgi:hypothetical protein